jgi:hypothetical protein
MDSFPRIAQYRSIVFLHLRRAMVEQAQLFPGIPIYGGSHQSPALTQLVKGDDQFTIGKALNVRSALLILSPLE